MPRMAAVAGFTVRHAVANEAVSRPARFVRLLLSCCSACTATAITVTISSGEADPNHPSSTNKSLHAEQVCTKGYFEKDCEASVIKQARKIYHQILY